MNFSKMIIWLKIGVLISFFNFSALGKGAESIDFLALQKEWSIINFDDITPTKYELQDKKLMITVAESNSFILLPFKEVKRIRRVSIEWDLVGSIEKNTRKREEEKSGDDFPLRVGLLVKGKKATIPFFAPSWVKLIRERMNFGVERIEYFVLGSNHKNQETWENPFSDDFKMTAVESILLKGGGKQADILIPQGLDVVGIWVMSDGDNTKSSFKVSVDRMVFYP